MYLRKEIEEQIKLQYPSIEFNRNDIIIENNTIKIKTHKRINGRSKTIHPISNYLTEQYFKEYKSSDTLYHFLPFKYVSAILKEKKIRLYNLNKYLKDDSAEFSYFLEQIGVTLPKSKEQINRIKENIFIFSCTTDNTSDNHWNRFGKHEKTVCLKMNINYTNLKNNALDIRKVVYATELKKLFCLLEEIYKNYNKRLEILGWSSYAKFTKKQCLDWEKEIRLSFDNNTHSISTKLGIPSKRENIYCDNGASYIEMSLKNDYFELKIEEVIVREDKWSVDLRSTCEDEYLNFTIDKSENK